jgi:hypothetical protein
MNFAIAREKAIKKWRRVWKIKLIEAMNPIGKICIRHCSDGPAQSRGAVPCGMKYHVRAPHGFPRSRE